MAWAEIVTGQLQATVSCSCICTLHDVMEITYAKQCQNSVKNSVVWESCWMPSSCSCISAISIYLKNKWKALNTLFVSAEYTITREEYFCFHALKSCLDIETRWTQCNHREQSCSVLSSWEGRETPPFSPPPFSPLWCGWYIKINNYISTL